MGVIDELFSVVVFDEFSALASYVETEAWSVLITGDSEELVNVVDADIFSTVFSVAVPFTDT